MKEPFGIRSEVRILTNLGELVRRHADIRPNAIALAAADRSPLTYRALLDQVRYVGDALNAYGIGRGDRVAIVLPNGPEMAVAFLATAASATSAPLSPDLRAEEFAARLGEMQAAAVIIDARFPSSIVRDVARRLRLPLIELHPSCTTAGQFTFAGSTGRDPKPTGLADAGDVAVVLTGQATAGRPRVVALTHANLCVSAGHTAAALELSPFDRCLNVLPLVHAHALVGAVLASLHAGGSVFCSPGFSEGSFLDGLERSQATWYTAVPSMHHAIAREASQDEHRARSGRLRFIRSCSSPLPPALAADLERRFGVPVIEAYGLTEAAHQVAANPFGRRKPGSVGLPCGVEIAILDAGSNRVPAGVPGEIAVRGTSVAAGCASPSITAEGLIDEGWFRTGDLAYRDDDGYIFITGRLTDIVNRGGEQIAPREVDDILRLHPAVAECLTFGAPHPTLGEELAAAVVVRRGTTVTAEQIRAFAAAHVAACKVPRRILILDALPGGSGNLRRAEAASRLGVTFHEPVPSGSRMVRKRQKPAQMRLPTRHWPAAEMLRRVIEGVRFGLEH